MTWRKQREKMRGGKLIQLRVDNKENKEEKGTTIKMLDEEL